MDDFQITRSVTYNGREVITPTEFSMMIKGHPSYLLQRKYAHDTTLPTLALKRGKREYYYLDDLLAWYENRLQEKVRQAEKTAEKLARAVEVNRLRQETNKASRKALLDTIRK